MIFLNFQRNICVVYVCSVGADNSDCQFNRWSGGSYLDHHSDRRHIQVDDLGNLNPGVLTVN